MADTKKRSDGFQLEQWEAKWFFDSRVFCLNCACSKNAHVEETGKCLFGPLHFLIDREKSELEF